MLEFFDYNNYLNEVIFSKINKLINIKINKIRKILSIELFILGFISILIGIILLSFKIGNNIYLAFVIIGVILIILAVFIKVIIKKSMDRNKYIKWLKKYGYSMLNRMD